MSETTTPPPVDHKRLGIDLFNLVWTYLEKPERSQADIDKMINAAHASRYHWGEVGAPVNFSRGEWQISRVYSVLGRGEPALYHAHRSLEVCQANSIGDFDLAFAYEALARAAKISGDTEKARQYYQQAVQAGQVIRETEDKDYFYKSLDDLKDLE